MAHRNLSTVLAALAKSLNQTEQLAAVAQLWITVTTPKGIPKFSVHHKEMVTELAFLRAFLAWEAFLEESFVLYLWGKKPPRGNSPKRFASPPTRKVAELLAAEGRDYADWTVAQKVIERAERFFQGGRPYSSVLKSQRHTFEEIKVIRNAIVHVSTYSQEQFRSLTRRKLGTYPLNLTVGGFLAMTVPGSSPPESFFESYLDKIRFAAERIVPR